MTAQPASHIARQDNPLAMIKQIAVSAVAGSGYPWPARLPRRALEPGEPRIVINNPELKRTVEAGFAGQGEEAPTWVEAHGLICAFAVGPYIGPVDFANALEMELEEPVLSALAELRMRLLTDMLAGERITLPCLLDPYREDDGNDLASWCAGFLNGVFTHEENWYADDEDAVANWLLPMILISGVDDDEALDELWENSQLVRQMANGLPDLLEELLLHFQGPEVDEAHKE